MSIEFLYFQYRYTDWQTVLPGTFMEANQRHHHLSLLVQDFDMQFRDPVCHVNLTEFLDAAPGHLLCESVTVEMTTKQSSETDPDRIVEVEMPTRTWCLRYTFSEQSGRQWNEIYYPAGDGRGVRQAIDFTTPIDMAAFFGHSTFPLV